jgi:hypothetical protein
MEDNNRVWVLEKCDSRHGYHVAYMCGVFSSEVKGKAYIADHPLETGDHMWYELLPWTVE